MTRAGIPPRPPATQNEKDALLHLAGSNEEAGFAERFQHFLITRQQEAGPEGGQLWHMRPARPEEQRCQRLCQRLLTALALRALLQEVRCSWSRCAGRMGGASCQALRVDAYAWCQALLASHDQGGWLHHIVLRAMLSITQGATEEGVRQEFGYGDLGRAFADMRVGGDGAVVMHDAGAAPAVAMHDAAPAGHLCVLPL